MINRLRKLFFDATLSPSKGSFLSDKSYKFDTVYFISNFIFKHLNRERIFNKKKYKQDCVEYVEKKFSLRKNSSASINYLTEVLNLLVFSNIMLKLNQVEYKLIKVKELKYIIKKMENSYIFLFLATYHTFDNEKLIGLYFKFVNATDKKSKEFYLKNLSEQITKKSKRVTNPSSVWGKLVVKYPLLVLGLFYKDKSISKELNITDEYITIKSLSMNVSGTKTDISVVKNNEYIFHFELNYVFRKLHKYQQEKNLIV